MTAIDIEISLKTGDFVRYKSSNIGVITSELSGGGFAVQMLKRKDFKNPMRRSDEVLTYVDQSKINLCPSCDTFVDIDQDDIIKCSKCTLSYHAKCSKKHKCSDANISQILEAALSKLEFTNKKNEKLNAEFSNSEHSTLNAGALTQQALDDENFANDFLVEIDKIIPGKQVRFSLNPEHVVKLQELIKTQGQLNPIIVFKVDNNYQIDDGHHRFEAIKNLEWKRINVIEIEKPENDIAELLSSYQSNMSHLSFSKLERGIALKILFEEMKKIDPEYSMNKFATDLIKEPYTTVREAIIIASLHPRIHALIEDEENPMSKKTAYKLKVMSLDEQVRFLDKFDNSIYQLNLWVEYWDKFTEKEKEKVFQNAEISTIYNKYKLIALEEKYDTICEKLDVAFDVKIEYELVGTDYQIRTSITSSLMNNLDIELFNGTKDIITNFQGSTNKSVSKFIKALKVQIEINKNIIDDFKEVKKQIRDNVSILSNLNNDFDKCEYSKGWPLFDYVHKLLIFNFEDDKIISDAEGLERCNLLNIELSRQIKLYELKNKLTEEVNQIELSPDQGEYGDRKDAILKLIIELPELDENDILDKIDNLKKDLLFIDIFTRGINLRSNARNYLSDTHKSLIDEVITLFSPDEFNRTQFSLDELIAFDEQLTNLESKVSNAVSMFNTAQSIMKSRLTKLDTDEIKAELIKYFSHEELPNIDVYVSDIINNNETEINQEKYEKKCFMCGKTAFEGKGLSGMCSLKCYNKKRKINSMGSLKKELCAECNNYIKVDLQCKYCAEKEDKYDFDGPHVIIGMKCDECPTVNYKCENLQAHNSNDCTRHNCQFDFVNKHDNCPLNYAHYKSECAEAKEMIEKHNELYLPLFEELDRKYNFDFVKNIEIVSHCSSMRVNVIYEINKKLALNNQETVLQEFRETGDIKTLYDHICSDFNNYYDGKELKQMSDAAKAKKSENINNFDEAEVCNTEHCLKNELSSNSKEEEPQNNIIQLDEIHSVDFEFIRDQVKQLDPVLAAKHNLTKHLNIVESNTILMLEETKKILLYKKRGVGLLKQPANEKKHEIMKCNLVKILKNDILEKYNLNHYLVDELESRVRDQAIQFSLIVIPDIEKSKVVMVPWIAPGPTISNMYWNSKTQDRVSDTYPDFSEVFKE